MRLIIPIVFAVLVAGCGSKRDAIAIVKEGRFSLIPEEPIGDVVQRGKGIRVSWRSKPAKASHKGTLVYLTVEAENPAGSHLVTIEFHVDSRKETFLIQKVKRSEKIVDGMGRYPITHEWVQAVIDHLHTPPPEPLGTPGKTPVV